MKKYLFLTLIAAMTPLVLMGFTPKGHIDSLYKLDRLPLIRPGVKCKMFSSFDRTGGNNDGFRGTYSYLRIEDENSVIAEMEGPGCIQRIWFTHSVINKDGLLNREGEHIRIYLDGSDAPAVDVPLEQIFSGELKPFPKPLVGSGLGGFYCYVPIPYRNGCKVVIEGRGVRFYQLTYNEFPPGARTESFTMEMTPEREKSLEAAVNAWTSPDIHDEKDASFLTIPYELDFTEETGPFEIDLPNGEHMIRGIFFETEEENRKAAGECLVFIRFEDSRDPAVNLPMDFLFGQAFQPEPFQSLLFGVSNGEWYNFIPMPYLWSAKITLNPKTPFRGKLKIALQPAKLEPGSFGYLHASYIEQMPTEDGMHFPFVNVSGRGHFLGVYMATEGKKGDPGWLEGDEKFNIDGQLMIHGTGTEDYFNCGWYAANGRLVKAGGFPLHGFPVYGKTEDSMRAAPYRWHVTDPVPYEKSINAGIEHGPRNDTNADYRSSVFFYDVNPSGMKNKTSYPVRDECIEYLRQRIWQLASDDPDEALRIIEILSKHATRQFNKVLLEGLGHYVRGVKDPTDWHLLELRTSLTHMEHFLNTIPREMLYKKPEIKLATDSDNLVPRSLATAKTILERAVHDLARKLARVRGFRPGDEIILEARDSYGRLTPEPHYTETEDFKNSYAKVEDPRLVGKGARFTYGDTDPSRARFTPDFPQAGYYEVFTIFSYGSNAGDTRYIVKHAGGEKIIPLEQRGRPGTKDRNNRTWISLGVYRFEKGQDPEKGSVTLDASPGLKKPNRDIEYRAYADSIRFVFMGREKN